MHGKHPIWSRRFYFECFHCTVNGCKKYHFVICLAGLISLLSCLQTYPWTYIVLRREESSFVRERVKFDYKWHTLQYKTHFASQPASHNGVRMRRWISQAAVFHRHKPQYHLGLFLFHNSWKVGASPRLQANAPLKAESCQGAVWVSPRRKIQSSFWTSQLYIDDFFASLTATQPLSNTSYPPSALLSFFYIDHEIHPSFRSFDCHSWYVHNVYVASFTDTKDFFIGCLVSTQFYNNVSFNGNNVKCIPVTTFPRDYNRWFTLPHDVPSSQEQVGSRNDGEYETDSWFDVEKTYSPLGRAIKATYWFSGNNHDDLVLEEYYKDSRTTRLSASVIHIRWDQWSPPVDEYYYMPEEKNVKAKKCTINTTKGTGAFKMNIHVAPWAHLRLYMIYVRLAGPRWITMNNNRSILIILVAAHRCAWAYSIPCAHHHLKLASSSAPHWTSFLLPLLAYHYGKSHIHLLASTLPLYNHPSAIRVPEHDTS